MGFLALITILCVLLLPTASAHRVHLQDQISEIQIRVWYGGGDPMTDADVEVYLIKDGKEELYLEGTTDENGMFFFAPKIGVSEYRVVAQATGHKGETLVNLTGGALAQQEVELPLSMRIISGFGYLIGLAGAGMLFVGWKLKKQYEMHEEKKR